jgi:hypothetical protein
MRRRYAQVSPRRLRRGQQSRIVEIQVFKEQHLDQFFAAKNAHAPMRLE